MGKLFVCFIGTAFARIVSYEFYMELGKSVVYTYNTCLGKESGARENRNLISIFLSFSFPLCLNMFVSCKYVCMWKCLWKVNLHAPQLAICILRQSSLRLYFLQCCYLCLAISFLLLYPMFFFTALRRNFFMLVLLVLYIFSYALVTIFPISVSSCFLFFYFNSFYLSIRYMQKVCWQLRTSSWNIYLYTWMWYTFLRILVVQLNYACVQSTIVPLKRPGKHTICESIHVYSLALVCSKNVHT